MKYGYMSSFEVDLLSEIDFAKKYFDFIEITLKLDLSEYTLKYISKINAALKNFEILGHIHWEIDLSKGDSEELKKIYKSIRIFKKLGAKKITIHPSAGYKQNIREIKQNNLFALSKIIDFCTNNKLQLLVENIASSPFNQASNLDELTSKIPNLKITFDIGHTNKTSKLELNKFLKILKTKIKHIHLHDNVDSFDHLFFKNKNKLRKIITKINSINYEGTVTLEMFSILKNSELVSINNLERRKLLVRQLELIKNL